ncbi:hypothetical protein [Hydrogenophilus thermoluteolus]|uniref:Uncharacterized protein n=1 Tax=Hydrogenophilus thermoluteolus TaxID=297 RepID=A0A2Z6DXR3_HYDTE|nr:hypothetical protein [Hydrogenophilus thermoluteolus]BBD77253.1 hypothetical protein HPTL_0986 [Hydrogenophilus thermoluteolus]
MANVTESAVWESGVYRIETTDPILGGENGTANIQAKQLANRTLWLKVRADQVDAAAAGYGSLQARLAALQANVEAVGTEMVNMDHTAVMQALSLAHMAHQAIDAMRFGPVRQTGEITIKNRGVVSGCTISKSTTAARNLNIAPGVCFANGQTYPVVEGTNAASVPANTSTTSAVVVSAYLYPHSDGQTYRLAVTAIGQSVPDNGIEIYRLTIPANNTDATDPNLTNVTLTDVRRIEPNFPDMLDAPVSQSVSFARPMKGADWRLHVDVVSATGAPCRADQVVVGNRATNGMTLLLASAADAVTLRWTVERLND